jgi:signal transduction histidine kinase
MLMTSITSGAAPAMSERRFAQIVIGTVVVGFLLLAGVVAMAGWLLARSQEFRQGVEHTYTVETRLFDFRVLFERTESARRGYLISNRPRYLNTFQASEPRLQPLLADLRTLTADNPAQQRRLDELQPLLAEKINLIEQTMALRRGGDLMGAMAAFDDPREQVVLDRIRILAAEMATTEQQLLIERTGAQTRNTRALLVVVVVAGVMLAILATASLWAMRRFASGMVRSQSQLKRLNEGLEEAVAERTADLRRANDEIQRFAYIVSHDLRSPLVNIMGFTSELEAAAKPLGQLLHDAEAAAPQAVSPEAKAVVESELPEAIEFIRSSTRKMDRLINAILKLSREGRRNLNPERLDMTQLVEGIAASLRVLADQKGAEVQVEGSLPPLFADRVAVEQVFSNLMENALKYLKPGTPGEVRVRGFVDGPRLIYEVEDNGRGIDPKDHERVFELFRRAGAQDQSGEGIGLAHVRALVYRLGGLIDCRSELDRGATFRLSLPLTMTLSAEAAV